MQQTFRKYAVVVTAAGVAKGEKIELDNNYEKMTGLFCVNQTFNNYPKLQSFSHNGVNDIFEEDFPIEFLMSSDKLSPDDRFKKLSLDAQKKSLQIIINDPGGNTYPYTLMFVYKLENKIR